MKKKTGYPNLVLHIVGLTLTICGIGMLMSAVVEMLIGVSKDWQPLLALGVGASIGGFAMQHFTLVPKRIATLDVFVSVTSAWVVMSFVGALPFVLTGAIPSFSQALFESVSGFTTTGATVLQPGDDPRAFGASAGVIIWRSMTQWIGGMGVIVLVIAVLPTVGGWGMGLLQAEAPGPTGERLTPRVRSTARRLWGFYLLFTLVMFLSYLAAGMDLYDAANHSLTTVSTGGFSPHTLSIAHFDSAAIEWISIVAMFIAGSSFTLLFRLFRGKPGPLFRSVEFRVYSALVLGASVLTFLTAGPQHRNADGFRGAVFSVVSIVSTTGYGTVDFVDDWSQAAQSILLILMPIGAMAGSTAGGVKLVRVLAVASFAHGQALGHLHPGLVRPVRVGKSVLDQMVVRQVIGFLVLSLAAFGGGSILIALTGADLVTAFSASATTIGNVGPGLGEIGPRSDFMAVSPFARHVCIVTMLLGRLEIYPIILALVKLPIPRVRPALARAFHRRL